MRLLLFCTLLCITACSKTYPNKDALGKVFPSVHGTSLSDTEHRLPEDFAGQPVLFLLGYKQASQFDIDRWLIGLDMTQTPVKVYELPTIAGLAPQFFQTRIDDGMRSGIPKEIWGGVITIYKDGEKVQTFTGNQNPNNARAILLDAQSRVVYFHDRGFSVAALNGLRQTLEKIGSDNLSDTNPTTSL